MHASELFEAYGLMLLRGSLAFVAMLGVERLLRGRVPARSLRWCWLLVLATWLNPYSLPGLLPVHFPLGLPYVQGLFQGMQEEGTAVMAAQPVAEPVSLLRHWPVPVFAGGLVFIIVILIGTLGASRRWSRRRLCTDASLLELLEDCKARAGVSVPFGVVVDSRLVSPALMGWLRPRILLPERLVRERDEEALRMVILHELAHFKAADIPWAWVMSLARALFWFNPLVHWHAERLKLAAELAADEQALAWLGSDCRTEYGRVLLRAYAEKAQEAGEMPRGVLCLAGHFRHIKQRIIMITNRSPRSVWPAFLSALFLCCVALLPLRALAEGAAPANEPAVKAALVWVESVDQGHYAQSWKDSAAFFRKSITSEKWEAALNQVRKPLGACTSRKLLASKSLAQIPNPKGGSLAGDYVVLQFAAAFDGLPSALETVSFEKEADGGWRCIGYFIKPAL